MVTFVIGQPLGQAADCVRLAIPFATTFAIHFTQGEPGFAVLRELFEVGRPGLLGVAVDVEKAPRVEDGDAGRIFLEEAVSDGEPLLLAGAEVGEGSVARLLAAEGGGMGRLGVPVLNELALGSEAVKEVMPFGPIHGRSIGVGVPRFPAQATI